MKQTLASVLRVWNGSAYNIADHNLKIAFHVIGKQRMRQLAKVMGLTPGSYTIRSNMAGMAVSGEVILHHDKFYVHLSAGSPHSCYFRACKGQKDYTGDRNIQFRAGELDDPYSMANKIINSNIDGI